MSCGRGAGPDLARLTEGRSVGRGAILSRDDSGGRDNRDGVIVAFAAPLERIRLAEG